MRGGTAALPPLGLARPSPTLPSTTSNAGPVRSTRGGAGNLLLKVCYFFAVPAPQLLYSRLMTDHGIPHAFTTRLGGVSPAPFDSLNFGNPMDLPPSQPRDTAANIYENFRRVLGELGLLDRELVQTFQVHGNRAHVFRSGEPSRERLSPIRASGESPGGASALSAAAGAVTMPAIPSVSACLARDEIDFKADALVTDDPARAVAVRVADCCPVLLATTDGRVVAAVHAGWRGVVSHVVASAARAIEQLHTLHQATDNSSADDADPSSAARGGVFKSVLAAIGPCIGPTKFEVGPEVVEEFARAFGHRDHIRPHSSASDAAKGKAFIDVPSAIAEQLESLGVTAIDIVGACTASDSTRFFSHRRDKGVTGRMIGVIAPRAERRTTAPSAPVRRPRA